MSDVRVVLGVWALFGRRCQQSIYIQHTVVSCAHATVHPWWQGPDDELGMAVRMSPGMMTSLTWMYDLHMSGMVCVHP